jgi:uncharacterized protein YndB with AHSA1/START domain
MIHGENLQPSDSESLVLIVRRTIPASAQFLFDAWTQPTRLKEWWGPSGVKCVEAHIDLRVGGSYRIANLFPDGNIIWITGNYTHVEPPRKLVYTWAIEPNLGPLEIVTVEFLPKDEDSTEIIVMHERIPNRPVRDQHEAGWQSCLDGLVVYARDRSNF